MMMRRWYWNLLDRISRLSPFDFYGGIIAGVGINILAALLITKLNSVSVTLKHALCMALGFIVAGTLVSMGRATLGEIRTSADPYGGKVEYYERFKTACKTKGHIALCLFLIGALLSIFLLIWVGFLIKDLMLIQERCQI